MFTRNARGERRLSPWLYKLLLTSHVVVSVGWLGAVLAKLVLGVAAVTSDRLEVASALYLSLDVVNVTFAPLAVATIITGVVLSLGTKWGLLEHYWVVTKLGLTVGVISTAVQLAPRVVPRTPAAAALSGDLALGLSLGPALLVAFSAAHLLMLTAATVISVYKPWGKTWLGRRGSSSRGAEAGSGHRSQIRDGSAIAS